MPHTNQTLTQKRVAAVLERMLKQVRENEYDAAMYSGDLEVFLNNIASEDGFGSEAQCDPRGDFRNGHWSMNHVEGVDAE